jgi:two-component system NtrC family response regulator
MKKTKILLVDDDKNLLRVLSYQIQELGFEVVPKSKPLEALRRIEDNGIDLVITDLRMPQMDGLELLEKIQAVKPGLPVIVLTAHGSIDKAVEAIQKGASDFLTKPFEVAEVEHAISNALKIAHLLEENRRLSDAVSEKFNFEGIIGSSKKFQNVLNLAQQLSQVDTTVLIQGESGTGKELIARAIHYNSPRKKQPFVIVNCGAIPSDLMESELFGYRKGAFTGANRDKQGKLEAADNGTVFLDEVGELPLNMQVKLLRVLQEGQIDIIGETVPRYVNLRVVAATNKNLQEMVEQGGFREDLFYRLSVAPLHVPSLRERREDIPMLVHHLLKKMNKKLGKEATFDEDVIAALQNHSWPGNVRELENLVERLVVFAQEKRVQLDGLPTNFRLPVKSIGKVVVQLPDSGFSLQEFEGELIRLALERNDWNQSQTARYLGMTRNTLIYRMQKFGLKSPD